MSSSTSESIPPVAAIVLCAGKGTRMGAVVRNKVCTPCAGVPVVRRILANLRAGGVTRFVVVTGFRTESVMRALDGERGVLFAYQREQLGTGDATRCGLRVLEDVGHAGPVVVTMGDKIVSADLVRELLAADGTALAVCGVQRRAEHPNGGHVVMDGDRALGIVEYADVRKALAEGREITLGGRSFPASAVADTPWVNTALYRFDAAALAAALAQCGRDNAQGEVYLTDTIELFASGRVSVPGRAGVRVYHVADPGDLLTFSTKEEFRRLNARFLRSAGALLADHPAHRAVLEAFIARYGAERPAVLVRAPGRVNLMGRHVEHRGGSVNVLATEAAT
ncbi:MAG: NTP transferase domain-containing protein, partial [Kiritimatiellae bacterium]|nr:NTP transferase domain-containing protein [Kiritimatiellia bacterium]